MTSAFGVVSEIARQQVGSIPNPEFGGYVLLSLGLTTLIGVEEIMNVAQRFAREDGRLPEPQPLQCTLESLEAFEKFKLVESIGPWTASPALAKCFPAVQRRYRLTRRGHTYRCRLERVRPTGTYVQERLKRQSR